MKKQNALTLRYESLLSDLKSLDINGWCCLTDGSIDDYSVVERIQIVREAIFASKFSADKACVGTKFYSGYAFFWAYKYRHTLRDATRAKRRQVHNAFLNAKLNPSQESDKHAEIIRKYFPNSGY